MVNKKIIKSGSKITKRLEGGADSSNEVSSQNIDSSQYEEPANKSLRRVSPRRAPRRSSPRRSSPRRGSHQQEESSKDSSSPSQNNNMNENNPNTRAHQQARVLFKDAQQRLRLAETRKKKTDLLKRKYPLAVRNYKIAVRNREQIEKDIIKSQIHQIRLKKWKSAIINKLNDELNTSVTLNTQFQQQIGNLQQQIDDLNANLQYTYQYFTKYGKTNAQIDAPDHRSIATQILNAIDIGRQEAEQSQKCT
jgi:hypothetical protein